MTEYMALISHAKSPSAKGKAVTLPGSGGKSRGAQGVLHTPVGKGSKDKDGGDSGGKGSGSGSGSKAPKSSKSPKSPTPTCFDKETKGPGSCGKGSRSKAPARIPHASASKASLKKFEHDFKGIGAGLRNLGNTCFLNSVLQSLTHSQLLVDAVKKSDHSRTCAAEEGSCVLCAMEQHISTARANGVPFSPLAVVQCLPQISSTLKLGDQEDAHEFLRGAVDAMQRALPDDDPNREARYPFSLFTGSIQSCIRCLQCQKTSVRLDPIEDIQLDVAAKTRYIHMYMYITPTPTLTVHAQLYAPSLETALGSFTRVEVLSGDNAYACEQCACTTEAQRYSLLHSVPSILSIQLKRFSFTKVIRVHHTGTYGKQCFWSH